VKRGWTDPVTRAELMKMGYTDELLKEFVESIDADGDGSFSVLEIWDSWRKIMGRRLKKRQVVSATNRSSSPSTSGFGSSPPPRGASTTPRDSPPPPSSMGGGSIRGSPEPRISESYSGGRATPAR